MRNAAAALALVLIAGSAAAAGAKWVTFTDPAGIFTVSAPTAMAPSDASTKTPDGRPIPMTAYIATDDHVVFFAVDGDYAGLQVDPAHALDNGVKAATQRGRTLISDKVVTVDGHSGREIRARDTSGEIYIDRLFFFGNHLYQFVAGLEPGASESQTAEANRFVASLRFLH